MHSVDPPAIVRDADRTAEMPATAKSMYAALKKSEGRNLDEALALGRLLETIKKQTAHGQWLPLLKSMEIPQPRAHQFMSITKLPAGIISKCDSIRQALSMVKFLDSLCKSCYHKVMFKGQKRAKGCAECAAKKRAQKAKNPDDDEELKKALEDLWDDGFFDGWFHRGQAIFTNLAVKAGYVDKDTNEAKLPPEVNGLIRKLGEIHKEAAKIVKEYRKQLQKDLFQEKRMP